MSLDVALVFFAACACAVWLCLQWPQPILLVVDVVLRAGNPSACGMSSCTSSENTASWPSTATTVAGSLAFRGCFSQRMRSSQTHFLVG